MGAAVDIGAFEFIPDIPALSMSQLSQGGIQLRGAGKPAQSCRLLASADLANWIPVATNQFGNDGTTAFYDNFSGGKSRFYRLVMP